MRFFFFFSQLTQQKTCYYLYFVFWHIACGILLPRPGVEPMSPAVEVLTTSRGSPKTCYYELHLAYLVTSGSLRPHRWQHARFPVLHHRPEFAQTHVNWVSDAIQPSHPLSSPSPPALNLSQHQGLFQWVGSSHQVAKVLELQLQYQSFQWIFRVDFL